MTEDITSIESIDDQVHVDETPKRKGVLILYFVLTFLWSWGFFIPKALYSQGIITIPNWLGEVFSGLGLFGPSIVAIILVAIFEKKQGLKNLLKKLINLKFKKIWFLPIILVPIITAGIAFGIVIAINGYDLTDNYYNAGFIVGATIIAFFVGGPLAEELGWRGFALDRLQKKWNALISSLILGSIWSIWHLPLHFISTTTQFYIPIWAFFLHNTTMTIIYTWIYNNTNGSVFATMLLHWVFNICGALLPFWQMWWINDQIPNNLWLPTYGMLVGYAILLITTISIVFYFGTAKLVRNFNFEKSKENV